MPYHISVFRQKDGGARPAPEDTEEGPRLAVWMTPGNGLNWIEDLVKEGKAVLVGSYVLQLQFSAQAKHIIPRILEGPPLDEKNWGHRLITFVPPSPERPRGTVITPLPGTLKESTFDQEVIKACQDDEWLLICAWDMSD